MPRPQTKRMQYRLYFRLLDIGPQTSSELLHWYNHERPMLSKTHSRGRSYGSTIQSMAGVLNKSILFDCIKEKPTSKYNARPLDKVVEKAIASRRPLKKFPHFLQLEITKKLEEEQ